MKKMTACLFLTFAAGAANAAVTTAAATTATITVTVTATATAALSTSTTAAATTVAPAIDLSSCLKGENQYLSEDLKLAIANGLVSTSEAEEVQSATSCKSYIEKLQHLLEEAQDRASQQAENRAEKSS